MKLNVFLCLILTPFAMVSCGLLDNLKKPLNSDAVDPLKTPFSKKEKNNTENDTASAPVEESPYSSGESIETSVPNAAFFKEIPKGNATADRILPVASPVEYLSKKDKYIKVKLENGQIGYIPSLMLAKKGTTYVPKEVIPSEDQLLKRIENEVLLENDLNQESDSVPQMAFPNTKNIVAPVQEQLKAAQKAVKSAIPKKDALFIPENKDGTISQDSSLE